MNESRRRWMQAMLIAPWIPQDRPSSRPSSAPAPDAALARARQVMKARAAPGIAVAIPTSARAQVVLADALNGMLEFEADVVTHALFLRAVWLVARRECLPLRGDETLVVLGADGERFEGVTPRLDERNDVGVRPLPDATELHAVLDRYEAARRSEWSKALPEPGESELAHIVAGMRDGVPDSTPELIEAAHYCGPGSFLLWTWRTTKDPKIRTACEHVLRHAWVIPDGELRFPFGVVAHPITDALHFDGCASRSALLPCGMAVASRRSQVVLMFLATEVPKQDG